ncbi:MAG: hypothetical protein JSV24_11825 [Bacteroidales bacterium]|nr:MAG: hypothetical protein JSV24_11825 [Bacteroidales bacterium]
MITDQKLHMDYQTMTELEIMPGEGSGMSILEILNKTITPGGGDMIRKVFRTPFSQKDEIIQRQESLKYIMKNHGNLDLHEFRKIMDRVEYYYYSKAESATTNHPLGIFIEGLFYMIKFKEYRRTINKGTRITIHFISRLSSYLKRNISSDMPYYLSLKFNEISAILRSAGISKLTKKDPSGVWTLGELFLYDKTFRDTNKKEMIKMIHFIYELDVLVAMAKAVEEYGLVFPEIIDSAKPEIKVKGLYHLFLSNPVGNSTEFRNGKNFLFLTGPNMSGKTTFLKSCGIAVFLAHLGMGVPAKSMRLTTFQSLFSSLNTSDNLTLGYSYFYSEVIRIRKAAENLRKHHRSFMIFDELFKGTNIKDAFDGSLLVIEGLMKWKTGLFILSSHLLELESEIRKYPNVFFQHFDSDVINGKPDFKFGLHDGISKERLGLLILKNEKIDELLEPDNPEQ